ncbi:hypothetical protein K6Y31_19865 [Motilimonas cestriensis]|uniref:Uncharacterized protein n=1 Tax=Motilimonas cestriensis TaxID=2742685 RepID=A0ABS8WDB5_9GAMM|nr:hypothetical protein [Motilimonas cestriensis]MCE2597037.1 hypothetical protein [Motilimonas cestriensis]
MKYLILLSLISGLAQGATCPDVSADQLGIEYVNQKGFGQASWRVWRQPNRIAYEYPGKGLIEIWQLKQEKVEFIRVFSQEKRGIYYSYGDLRSINQSPDWQQVNQMLPPNRRSQLGKATKQEDNCFHYQHYQQNGQLSLTWNQDLNVPTLIVNLEKKQRIQQRELFSSKQSQDFFSQVDQYDLLDFADIGDSEADPFVRRMIKLGYVNHGNNNNYPNSSHQH